MSEEPTQRGGIEVGNVDEVIRSMEEALTLDGIAAATEAAGTGEVEVFGSQLMKEFDPNDAPAFMTAGPTFTNSGKVQDSDDGDTGPGSEN
jgi:hypothetical protein